MGEVSKLLGQESVLTMAQAADVLGVRERRRRRRLWTVAAILAGPIAFLWYRIGVGRPFNPFAFPHLSGEALYFVPMLVIFILSLSILTQTRFGRYVYAIGSNPEVSRLSGIPINRYVVAVYAISGLLAGVGGLILTGRLASADPNSATGSELDVIAAVVIGGTSLFGGRGGVFGTLVGALIISVVANGLVLLNVNPFWT